MSSYEDVNAKTPVELVVEDGDPDEIKSMLDYRWNHGWRLDRIIHHHPSQKVLIYYFVKKC